MALCDPCWRGYHGRCDDPFGRARSCLCFAENETHRYQHNFADDGMAGDLEKDRGDGGLGSGQYIERWEQEREARG